MKQKHLLMSLAILATGIPASAQTRNSVKTTLSNLTRVEACHRQ